VDHIESEFAFLPESSWKSFGTRPDRVYTMACTPSAKPYVDHIEDEFAILPESSWKSFWTHPDREHTMDCTPLCAEQRSSGAGVGKVHSSDKAPPVEEKPHRSLRAGQTYVAEPPEYLYSDKAPPVEDTSYKVPCGTVHLRFDLPTHTHPTLDMRATSNGRSVLHSRHRGARRFKERVEVFVERTMARCGGSPVVTFNIDKTHSVLEDIITRVILDLCLCAVD
jgi:hypothetical protein